MQIAEGVKRGRAVEPVVARRVAQSVECVAKRGGKRRRRCRYREACATIHAHRRKLIGAARGPGGGTAIGHDDEVGGIRGVDRNVGLRLACIRNWHGIDVRGGH